MATERFDLLLIGGTLLDGSGSPARIADVGITGDRITDIGNLAQRSSLRTLDCTGLCVAPGFIDIHTHSDVSVTYDPPQASAIGMGVTTQVVGNCALSLGFATDDPVFAFEKRALALHGARITWSSFAGHLDIVEGRGTGTNYVPLAGHGTLRKRVMGMQDTVASAEDLAAMRQELERAFEAGAWGISSGLEYPPSAYAGVAELTNLCQVAAAYGGLYATHLRNEGDTLVEAVQEALDVAAGASVPLQLSHHKAEGRHNWGKIRTTLAMVDAARDSGLDVQMDQYPYTAYMTGLAIQTLPAWAVRGDPEEYMARLRSAAERTTIREEIITRPGWSGSEAEQTWSAIQIGVCRGRPELQGRSIASLAREAGQPPLDYVLDLLIATDGFVSAVNFAIGEEDIAEVMRYPWTSIGSDGVGTHPGGSAATDRIHPRAYGTFPRVLGRYVRELNVLSLEKAVHKMSGLPAARLGLENRGLLMPGSFADITVFDPLTVGDLATFEEPHQFARGITHVFVNGAAALLDGRHTEHLGGRVLRRGSAQRSSN